MESNLSFNSLIFLFFLKKLSFSFVFYFRLIIFATENV